MARRERFELPTFRVVTECSKSTELTAHKTLRRLPHCPSLSQHVEVWNRSNLVHSPGIEPENTIWCRVQESNLILMLFRHTLNHQTSSPCNIFAYSFFSIIIILSLGYVFLTISIFSLSLPHQYPFISKYNS